MANKLVLTLSLVIMLLSDLGCTNNPNNPSVKNIYHVYNIDSTGNYYIIYARIGKAKYQIVSRKENCTTADAIKVGKNYDFDLVSIFNDSGFQLPRESVGSIKVDSVTILYLNDSIRDIYTARNTRGLCFLNRYVLP
jgi:hypothetical protein